MTATGAQLVCRLGEARYRLPADRVSEVAPLAGWTPVPGQGAPLLGVTNRRGDIRPVLDLHDVMNRPAPPPGCRFWAVFVRLDDTGGEIGLRVDGIERLTGPADSDATLPAVPLDRLETLACLRSRLSGKDPSP